MDGGGIGCYRSEDPVLRVQNSVLTGNSAKNGGGVYGNYKTTIEGNIFKDNSALQQGGAIYASGTVTLQKNTITQNMVPSSLGCVVRLVDINNSSVIGGSEENANVITDNFGDGIYFKGDSAFNYNCVHNNDWYEFVCGNLSDGSDIDATNNYWGTTDESEIE